MKLGNPSEAVLSFE